MDTRVHLTKVRPGDVLVDEAGGRWDVRLNGSDLVLRQPNVFANPISTDKDGFLIGLTRPPLEYDL